MCFCCVVWCKETMVNCRNGGQRDFSKLLRLHTGKKSQQGTGKILKNASQRLSLSVAPVGPAFFYHTHYPKIFLNPKTTS